MKKHTATIILLMLAMLSLASCNKRCACTKFDGITVDYYTPDEVKAQGKTCYEMRYFSNLMVPYYSYCEWDY